ncbi:MAG TPA: molybdopterin cofactor-binding domain-containing protein [Burkholderiales bacterium]|nr:molybdopterin cofactor-binding domain-containing protein [Burkholderiales bacterium]
MTNIVSTDRRSFLVSTSAAAGGLALGMVLPFGNEAQAAERANFSADNTLLGKTAGNEVTAWVFIKPDDTVVIRIARSEMGQGTMTGLAQLVAEELDCDWAKVTTEFPTPGQNLARNRPWKDFFTAGSRGIRASNEFVRQGGATARMMLVQAAADKWKVPVAECSAASSVITHGPSGRKISYGKVAAAAAKIDPPKEVKLKDSKDWKIAGKPLKRLDTAPKTNGTLIYSIDVKLPGMLCAAIRDCPVFGGTVKSFDAAKAEKMRGVKKVMQVGKSAVAVVATHWWEAKVACDAVTIDWDLGPNANVSSASIAAILKEGLDASTNTYVGNENGNAREAIAKAVKKVEAVYAFPYQHHATMEPMNATALWTADRCEVWTATQDGEVAMAATSESSGHPLAKCDVHKLPLGGGFGRRTTHDFVIQAVNIAKQMPGVPVKLIWSREEDMTHGRYHPTTQCKMTGAFDENNNLTGLHMRISGQSIIAFVAPHNLVNGKDPFTFQGLNAAGTEGVFGYTVPNLLVDHAMRNPHIPPHFWRGVNNNQNSLYLESFMDELALSVGQDPLEFRRKLLKDHPKHLAVLNAVAERAGWGKPAPEGVFRGLSQHMGYGSYVAACAEVSVSKEGALKIHRIVAATDCGYAVNPAQIERQIAGSFAYGLSAMLFGECTVKDGAIEQKNFDTYRVMRINEMPKVEAIVMPSGGFWGGVGEPTIFVAAPAVLNAIAAATGKRIRQLPIKDQDLRKA